MADVRIGIVGCAGRMGRTLIQQIHTTEGVSLSGGTEAPGHAEIGADLGSLIGSDDLGLKVSDENLPLFANSDAVLDFTVPAATLAHAALAAQARIVHVIGTTGLEDADEAKILAASKHARIIKAGNFSLGVNLVAELTRQLASTLGEEFDVEIIEMHHRHKVDAPSGTAMMLGEAAAEGRDRALGEVAVRGRDGITGERRPGDIGFASLRGGNVVGDHTVIFAADNERIEITHRAADRAIFARGAIRAAIWGQDKDPGLYDMADVLGFGK